MLEDPSPTGPRALKEIDAIQTRHRLRADPHIAPLAKFVDGLRTENRGFVPDFDPLDGGVDAEILFLLEKPGPKTDPARGGSGFISRDNDDPSAEALYCFMETAGVPRRASVIWNMIPWWNGTTDLTAAERRDGMSKTAELLRLLPRLRSVVLVGNQAKKARGIVEGAGMRVFESAHPSAQVRGTNRKLWDRIPGQWRQAYEACLPTYDSTARFSYGPGDLQVETSLSDNAAEEYAALQRVWAARTELDEAMAELRRLRGIEE